MEKFRNFLSLIFFRYGIVSGFSENNNCEDGKKMKNRCRNGPRTPSKTIDAKRDCVSLVFLNPMKWGQDPLSSPEQIWEKKKEKQFNKCQFTTHIFYFPFGSLLKFIFLSINHLSFCSRYFNCGGNLQGSRPVCLFGPQDGLP